MKDQARTETKINQGGKELMLLLAHGRDIYIFGRCLFVCYPGP